MTIRVVNDLKKKTVPRVIKSRKAEGVFCYRSGNSLADRTGLAGPASRNLLHSLKLLPPSRKNALGKALQASEISLEAVCADDSGLVIPALGGEPGVRSARYGRR